MSRPLKDDSPTLQDVGSTFSFIFNLYLYLLRRMYLTIRAMLILKKKTSVFQNNHLAFFYKTAERKMKNENQVKAKT